MFWKRKDQSEERGVPASQAIPGGRRVYAIGDIHGRDDLFFADYRYDTRRRCVASAGGYDPYPIGRLGRPRASLGRGRRTRSPFEE